MLSVVKQFTRNRCCVGVAAVKFGNCNRLLHFVMNGSSSSSASNFVTDNIGCVNRSSYTVCIEGNIGSGKTTLLDHFHTVPGVKVIQEPVDLWRNVRGHNPLGCMYKDPQRWSMALQTYIQLTMLDIHKAKPRQPVKMMERSIHSARYCFVENLHNSGVLPTIEYTILDEWYKWICTDLDVHVDLIVYIRASPEKCLERIRKRCRKEETGISMDLLQSLHTVHEDWLIKKSFGEEACHAPVMVLEADCDVEGMVAKFKEREDVILGRKAFSAQ